MFKPEVLLQAGLGRANILEGPWYFGQSSPHKAREEPSLAITQKLTRGLVAAMTPEELFAAALGLIYPGALEILLFVPLTLATIVVVLCLRRKSAVRHWILRRIDRMRFERAFPRQMAEPEIRLSYIPLPFAPASQIAFLSCVALIRLSGTESESLRIVLELVIFIGVPVLLVSAFTSHLTYWTSRRGKYEQLLAGLGLFVMPAASIWEGELIRLLLLPAFTLGLQLFFSRLCSVASPDRLASIYRMTVRMTKWVLFLCFVLLLGFFVTWVSLSLGVLILYAYLALRYSVTFEMERHPIIFLRSFSYSETPTVFGRIVSPVASRFGVVVALVHRTQPPSELHRGTSSIFHAHIRFAPDASWQEVLRRYLKSSSAVIIDLTVESEGVSWELRTAVQSVGKNSVVILRQRHGECAIPEDIAVVEYDLDEKTFKTARLSLRKWLLSNFSLSTAASRISQIAET